MGRTKSIALLSLSFFLFCTVLFLLSIFLFCFFFITRSGAPKFPSRNEQNLPNRNKQGSAQCFPNEPSTNGRKPTAAINFQNKEGGTHQIWWDGSDLGGIGEGKNMVWMNKRRTVVNSGDMKRPATSDANARKFNNTRLLNESARPNGSGTKF